jgi:hypothetical protein
MPNSPALSRQDLVARQLYWLDRAPARRDITLFSHISCTHNRIAMVPGNGTAHSADSKSSA